MLILVIVDGIDSDGGTKAIRTRNPFNLSAKREKILTKFEFFNPSLFFFSSKRIGPSHDRRYELFTAVELPGHSLCCAVGL